LWLRWWGGAYIMRRQSAYDGKKNRRTFVEAPEVLSIGLPSYNHYTASIQRAAYHLVRTGWNGGTLRFLKSRRWTEHHVGLRKLNRSH